MGGLRGATHKKVEIIQKLSQLQNLIKRDPPSYKEEFAQQHRNYLSELELFKLKPSKESQRFTDLVTFMSHMAPIYKDTCKEFPQQLMALLEEHAAVLQPAIRMKLVQALILVRNRGLLHPTDLLQLFFKLFRVKDKALRAALFEHIVNDVKSINLKGRNDKMNRTLQSFMYTMMADESELAAKKSLDVMVELYRCKVWTDARTVNAIGSAICSDNTKLMCTALNFFLNIETRMADDEDDDGPEIEINLHEHAKKTAANARRIKRSQSAKKKAMKKKVALQEGEGGGMKLFPAINLLNDPQGIAEKAFKRLRSSHERFEVKLLLMNFISRCIGCHQLLVLRFYSHVHRYIQSHQRDVTHILAFTVQACHDLVPPEELMPIIKAVATNFVTERCTPEVMAVGINTIREILHRVPALLQEDNMDGFVQDLAAYSKHRNKSVVIAARGLVNCVRDLYPALLKSRDRGKFHDPKAQPANYGAVDVKEGVDGAELLQLHEEGELEFQEEDEEEEEEEMGDDEEGWHDVVDDENDDETEKDKRKGEAAGDVTAEMEEDDEDEEMDDDEDDEDEDDGDVENEEVDMEEEEDEEEEEVEVEEEAVEDKQKKERKSEKATKGKRKGKEAEEEEEEDSELEAPQLIPAEPVVVQGVDGEGGGAGAGAGGSGLKRVRLDAQRILTTEDFVKIKKLRAAAAQQPHTNIGKKRKLVAVEEEEEDDSDDDERSNMVVAAADLEGYRVKRKATLEQRLTDSIARKEKFKSTGHAGGLTNKEKERKKNYLMLRKSMQVKQKMRVAAKSINRANRAKVKGKGQQVKVQLSRDKRKKRRT